ncbi:MAG: rRNA-processing protein bfr2 [Bogoriella megaspora]|nr:MAG: rRNA-processing protein bfr2 [Bogoriella megaspora]
MAPGRLKTLADQIGDLDLPFKDYDPEDQPPSDTDKSDEGPINDGGREHYEAVGKSKLRRSDVANLGPRYEGSRVSRNVALDEEEDNAFERGVEDESSDEDEEELERHAQEDNMNDSDGRLDMQGQNHPTSEINGDEDMQVEGFEEDGEEDSEEDDEDRDEDESRDSTHQDSRAQLRKMMSDERKVVTSTLSQAAKADTEKGRAVRKQRKTFDSLLNSRIRLQKALIATNSFPVVEPPASDVLDGCRQAVESAETAAFRLWSTLNDLRHDLQDLKTGQKRKRTAFEESTHSSALWDHMQSLETDSIPQRKAVLDKWSAKTRVASSAPTNRLNSSASKDETAVDVLISYLTDMPRLLQRARTPRSCAPIQASQSAKIKDPNALVTYDDADFYSILLKTLLEQTSADIDTSALAIPNQWQLARQARTKKVVDTQASKGRKVRYTVAEKLQNFMAQEDREGWGDRQTGELIGGLMGNRGTLREEDEEISDDHEDEVEDAGLLLFGK